MPGVLGDEQRGSGGWAASVIRPVPTLLRILSHTNSQHGWPGGGDDGSAAGEEDQAASAVSGGGGGATKIAKMERDGTKQIFGISQRKRSSS